MHYDAQRPTGRPRRANGIPRLNRPEQWTLMRCGRCFELIGAFRRLPPFSGAKQLKQAHAPHCPTNHDIPDRDWMYKLDPGMKL